MSSMDEETFQQMMQEALRTRDGASAAVPIFVKLTQEQVDQMSSGQDGTLYLPQSDPAPALSLWKVKELAAALRVSPGMVYAWIHRGDIAVIRTPGGRIRIPAAEVESLLRAHARTSEDSPLT